MLEKETLYLLPQRHPTAQSTGQTDDFGHKRLKRQVLLQDNPPQYRLHLRNTWTWVMKKKEMPGGMWWWSGEKGLVERKVITERGMRGINEERGRWVRGKDDWFAYSFLYAHLIRGILYGFPAAVTTKTPTAYVLGGLMVHYRVNYNIPTQKYDGNLNTYVYAWLVQMCVSVYVRLTHSLRGQNLCESCWESDEHYRVGDPGDVLQKHVAVQSTIHPLLCCTHTHARTNTYT